MLFGFICNDQISSSARAADNRSKKGVGSRVARDFRVLTS